jgi:TldD protein
MGQEDNWLTRRDFIKGTAAAGAGALILPGIIASPIEAANIVPNGSVDPRLLEKLLSRAMGQGADFAEVYVESSVGASVNLEEDKIRSAEFGISQGVGIRVISGLKVGYAYSDDFAPEILLQTADVAAKIASGPTGSGAYAVNPRKIPNLSPFKIDPAQVPVSEKVKMLLAGNEAAKKLDPRVSQVIAAYTDGLSNFTVANTDGLLVNNTERMMRAHFYVIAEENGDKRTGFWGGGGRFGYEWFEKNDGPSLAREAARQAVTQLGAKEAPVGEQTVVLEGGWGGVLLHEAVGHGLEADFIRKKTSLFAGRVGEKVASELCTVIDDGTIPNLRGTINVDDEGTPTERKVLIENGILKGFMYDRLNAKLMGKASTGSGRRQSYKHTPMPRMTNTYLAAGKHDPKEIIASVKNGFYAKNLGGGQVDISNGSFVFEVREGYLIEDGKVTAPVKNATLIGVGPTVLSNIDMVGTDARFDPGIGTCGKDGQSVPVGVGVPTVRIQNLTVGGTKSGAKEMI